MMASSPEEGNIRSQEGNFLASSMMHALWDRWAPATAAPVEVLPRAKPSIWLGGTGGTNRKHRVIT